MSTELFLELEANMQEVYPAPDFDLKDKIVVHQVACPVCAWKAVAWSDDVAYICLIEHMRMEHKEEILQLIKDFDNFDQVVLDMLTKPPVNFGRQLLQKQKSTWAVPLDVWMRMPDVVTL